MSENCYSYNSVDDLKIPPHSIEAEQSVLGSLMVDNQAWDRVVDCLYEKDFYRFNHRLIFRAMADLSANNQPMDVLTVAEVLKSKNELDNAGGEIYLYELSKNTPSTANIIAYAYIVRDRSMLRQLLAVATEIADSAFNTSGRSSSELLDNAESKVFAIAGKGIASSGPVPILGLLAKAVDRIDTLFQSKESITGLSTGYQELDELTSGLQDSDLIVVAGRPSMGKTTFAMNIAEHAAIRGNKPILIFSMEMPGDSLAMRMMSSLGRIDQNHIRTGKLEDDDWPRLSSAVSILSKVPMFIDDTPSLSPSEIRTRSRRLAKEHGKLGLIVIDYLQLMKIPEISGNRVAEISEISRSLKALAKELQVPVIALSQLNRSLEHRQDKRPVMSDLRESGAIEQDADLIVFIYRDEHYNENTSAKGMAEIIIAKQRNGPIGKVNLAFMGKYTRFENFAATRY